MTTIQFVMKKKCLKITHHRWEVHVGEIWLQKLPISTLPQQGTPRLLLVVFVPDGTVTKIWMSTRFEVDTKLKSSYGDFPPVALTLKYSGSETDRVQWNFITLVEANNSQGVYGLGLVAMSKSSDNRSLNDPLDVTIRLSAISGGAYLQPFNGEVNLSFVVLPCPPGYQKLQEDICYPCDPSRYSMTGDAQGCTPCPGAEVCIKQIPTIGNLTMIIQKGLQAIIGKSTLEKCPYAEACNESNCTLTYEFNNTQKQQSRCQ